MAFARLSDSCTVLRTYPQSSLSSDANHQHLRRETNAKRMEINRERKAGSIDPTCKAETAQHLQRAGARTKTHVRINGGACCLFRRRFSCAAGSTVARFLLLTEKSGRKKDQQT